jgi:monothiol glutaredoxin
MKGEKDNAQCRFSYQVVKILNILKINFTAVNVLEDDNIRQGVKDFSEWPTIPQLFVNKKFIGGCDIINELHMSNSLLAILKK